MFIFLKFFILFSGRTLFDDNYDDIDDNYDDNDENFG